MSAAINKQESMLQDAPLDCDANAEVLSDAETETLLENVEMSTSTPVPAETKKNRKRSRRNRQKLLLKGKRPKQPAKVACALCNGLFANMRQHLSKTRQNLTECQRKFLISFYRTSICSSTVYQCNTCVIRFTGKGKHLKLCKKPAIVRVKATCTNDFPESLKESSIWNANSGTGKATSLLEEYNINREEGGDPELTRFQRNFLTAVLKGTQFLRVRLKIKGALGQIQKQKKYTYQTMRKLMFELLRMVEFLKAYKAKELRINGPLVEGTIRTLLRKTAKKSRTRS